MPNVAWDAVEGAARTKHAKALADYAIAENTRIESELRGKTLLSRARQEDATAKKLEVEARILEVREVLARVELVERLRQVGAIPVWDDFGNMTVVKAPSNFDWDELIRDGVVSIADIKKVQPALEPAADEERPSDQEPGEVG